jgi:DNA sulfur modification protein DndB
MAITVPVIQGQMGSTRFYEAKMSARELVASTRAPRDMDGWANFSLEERLQRELNDKRVDDEIVPYLAKSGDRFFSSIVVLIYNADVTYESLSDVIPGGLPAAYRSICKDVGFLTINGGELVVLDGQHRASALGKVIHSKDDLGEFTKDVANDELAVIFVELNESVHIRRIFNKINRNARPTSRGDNIITSEDDGFAIVTRWLLREGEPLGLKDANGGLIVNWKSNTLPDRSAQFTTVSAVYDTVRSILVHYRMVDEFNEKKNVVRPSKKRLDEAYEHVKDWWLAALHGMDGFKEAFANPIDIPAMRQEGQRWSLLLKPAAHIVLFRALSRAADLGDTHDAAIAKANDIDWNITSEEWKGVLIAPNGRIMARNENYEVAAELVTHLIAGYRMTDQAISQLHDRVSKMKGEQVKSSTSEHVDDSQLQDLLKPVGRKV